MLATIRSSAFRYRGCYFADVERTDALLGVGEADTGGESGQGGLKIRR